MKELYQSITAAIIKDLEAGVAPWVKPWKCSGGDIMPRNYATRRAYSGINVIILWDQQIKRGYPTSQWMTYKQAREANAQVRGGEKATTVVYTNTMLVGEGEDEKRVGYLKRFFVFNVAQMDGIETASVAAYTPQQGQVDRFLEATHANIRHGGDRAFYSPSHDFIQLPPRQQFDGEEHYWATALHEAVHWSGHKTRLDRDLKPRFDQRAYAAEELVAELGAAFLCAHLHVEGRLRHADYIGHWLELLKDDPRAVFTAAAKASEAADYLRSFSEPKEEAA